MAKISHKLMKKRCLVDGANGFVGKYLVKELVEHEYHVYPMNRDRMNLLDYEQVHARIREIKPDYIFHLAGVAYVPTSWKDPGLVFDVNTKGSLNLFEAIRSNGIDPVIQIACSSEEYGLVKPEETPIDEWNILRPQSPYAVSKIAMDFLGYQYFQSYGMKIIRTRAFNHEGAGRPKEYMPSGFAYQIAMIEKGKMEPIIKHGNLEARRDITDVRDVAVAYRLAVEKGLAGEVYNIGSGQAYSVKEIIQKLVNMANVKVELQQDPNRLRPSDVPLLLCDSSKFREQTRWEPKYTLEETLKSELDFWRENV